MMAGAASALAPALMPAAAQGGPFDYRALAAIRELGLDIDKSEVMKTASYLLDVLGPRLSGSPHIRKAGEWVVEKMKGWGLSGAALEPWPVDPTGGNHGFPRGWSNEKFYMHATAPVPFPISGMSTAWTPGTNGLVSGECILAVETSEAELRARYAGRLRGKWVLGQASIEMQAQWEPVAKRLTRDQLDSLETPDRPPEQGAPAAPSPAPPPNAQAFDRFSFFFEQGALGVLSTNRGHGVFALGGAPRNVAPDQQIPRIVIEAEHYGRLARAVSQGQGVTVEADIRNAWHNDPAMFNVVGEIRGTTQPEEIVIIGAHFDSWHAATGATDNGGACATMLEAMRLLKATGAPLKRTVRICLWNGEEQGLIGSRLYVATHFGGVRGVPAPGNPRGEIVSVKRAHARFQAYFNLDNGAGSIRGFNAQGNRAVIPIFRDWIEPVRDLGVSHVSPRSTGSTDHVPFDQAGLPGFQFIQDPIEYFPKTHHTNRDYFEALQPEDMRRNAVILASFAMMAANHPGLLPRKPKP